jgi:hypothetical protein
MLNGYLVTTDSTFSGYGRRRPSQIQRILVNILNKQSWTANNASSSRLGGWTGAKNCSPYIKLACYKYVTQGI